MTTEAGTEGAEDAAAQAALLSQEPGDRDFDADARKMGWVPEEEFRGDRKPARFKTAQEFVEDGEAMSPHVRRLLKEQESQFEQRIGRIEKANASAVKKLTEIHNNEIADLKAQKKAAVKDGNVELVEQLDAEIDKRREATPTTEEATDINAEFAKRHDWYGTDKELTALAIGISQDVLAAAEKAGKVITMDEMFDAVAKEIKSTAAFKERSKKTGANGHAPVDGGSDNPGPSPNGKKTWNDLPAEAKRAYEGFDPRVKNELPKEKYAKEYFDA